MDLLCTTLAALRHGDGAPVCEGKHNHLCGASAACLKPGIALQLFMRLNEKLKANVAISQIAYFF